MEDPSFDGSDAYRMFVDRSASKIRSAAASIRKLMALDDGATDDCNPVDDWLIAQPDLHWFSHDWRHWCMADDDGALEGLGWRRTVVERGSSYRVTLTLDRERRVSRPRRSAGTKTKRATARLP